jgi:catechol 2,3-dioxygenase-like lactoylglutathione lyase family enzyme
MPINDAPVHPSLAVTDIARSRKWYAEKLGWEPIPTTEDPLIYKVGDSYFTLFTTPSAGTAKNTVMNWNVDDLSEVVPALKGRGVAFEDYDFGEYRTVDGILSDPVGGKTAWFKDPDGNIIAILQAAPGQRSDHALSLMLAAADLDRARAWYAEKLGFEPVSELAGVILAYTSGGTAFNVYKTEFAGSAQNTVGVFRMQGIREEIARLKTRGVMFPDFDFGDGDRSVGGIMFDDTGDLQGWFQDSEGNWLALAEDRGGIPE